jgi:predicted O-methyltransferase YrrM
VSLATFDPSPFSGPELLDAFHATGSSNQHLLTLYGLAVGLRARTIVELGLGSSTRALRAAAVRSGGVLHSCDVDVARFGPLREREDAHWRLYLGSSRAFLDGLAAPIDFAFHDAAHDYFQVKEDLARLLPKMSTFGIVCVHDTQQAEFAHDMLRAIRDAVRGFSVSLVTLPVCNGLTVLRLESGPHPPVEPMGDLLPDGRFGTRPVPFPATPEGGVDLGEANTSLARWLRWRARKIVKGF